MPIQEQNIKLVKSSVMLDVREGGGPPSANVIVDAQSNAIFDDISELARAGGNVSMRKTHVVVQTADTDGFFGTNVIIAEPPKDPRVSVTLFSTGDTFDTRLSAQTKVEAYLNKGPEWPGFLYENHIAGQRVIQLFQRPEEILPNVGQTLVLIEAEDLPTIKQQYVRAVNVSSVIRMFYDEKSGKDYPAAIVSVEISDVLRYDMRGTAPNREFQRDKDGTKGGGQPYPGGATKTRDTVVADAGAYVGVVPLVNAAAVGDFTVNAQSIYTQLVPSAQTETPIADSRATQQAYALVKAGEVLVQNLTMVFTTAQNMFVGGSILPGSFSIERSGVTVTDSGGVLKNGSAQVGIIDYENGVLQLSTNLWGTTGDTHVVSYKPASKFFGSVKSVGVPVSQETRSLSYVLSLNPPPAPGSLTVSYMVARRWYVLHDYGNGALRGLDAAYGAGTLNFNTGTVIATLGALPDVGSSIIFQWVETSTAMDANTTQIRKFSRWAVPMNSLGQIGTAEGKFIQPSGLTITWRGPDALGKTAHDDGYGALTGDAVGWVDYTHGSIWFSPNALPAKDTIISMDINGAYPMTSPPCEVFGGTVAANLAPHSISFNLTTTITYRGKESNTASSGASTRSRAGNQGYIVWYVPVVASHTQSSSHSTNNSVANLNVTMSRTQLVRDDGLGNLYFDEPFSGRVIVGTINYTTGVMECTQTPVIPPNDFNGPKVAFSSAGAWASSAADAYTVSSQYAAYYGDRYNSSSSSSDSGNTSTTWSEPWDDCYMYLGGERFCTIAGQTPTVRYTTAGASQDSISVGMTLVAIGIDLSPTFSLGVVSFTQGGKNWLGDPSGQLIRDISPTTGKGTVVGEMLSAMGSVIASNWVTGSDPTITNWRANQVAPGDGPTSPGFSQDLTFRTAAAPLRPGSFQVSGQMLDGTTFTAQATLDGKINSERCLGTINYETGLIRLFFVKKTNDTSRSTYMNYAFLGIGGVGYCEVALCNTATLRYNAVSYSYLPLNADILGIDPVRLPSDGRVPIFRAGGFAVIGNTQKTNPQVASNGQTLTTGRTRLSRVRLIDANGLTVTGGYTPDLDAGTVHIDDVALWAQPIVIEHRIEDMAVIRDAQISGELSFTRAITHDYPVQGSYISSALVAGDLRARVSLVFDQATWDSKYIDTLTGNTATASYNNTVFPISVTNAGAVTEKWVVRFTSSTAYEVIGENVGIIATGNTSTDCSPTNPVTNAPYFTLYHLGFGTGWSAGNVLRINTVGAQFPVWVVRTVMQGPETVNNDSFAILVRGDVDAP